MDWVGEIMMLFPSPWSPVVQDTPHQKGWCTNLKMQTLMPTKIYCPRCHGIVSACMDESVDDNWRTSLSQLPMTASPTLPWSWREPRTGSLTKPSQPSRKREDCIGGPRGLASQTISTDIGPSQIQYVNWPGKTTTHMLITSPLNCWTQATRNHSGDGLKRWKEATKACHSWN